MARGGLTDSERLLHVPGKADVPPACDLAVTEAPALLGPCLGMSAAKASTKLGGISPILWRCGLLRGECLWLPLII